MLALIVANAVHAELDDEPGNADLQARGKNAELPSVSERGVLTPKGRLAVESSLRYVHSKAIEGAIEGFTIIPAIAIGLFNVSQVQRDTVTQAFGLKLGLAGRAELDIRAPYLYKTETVRERQVFEGSRVDIIRDSSGYGLGDVESVFITS